MYPARTAEPEIREIGGEPLEGSGFETQESATAFESYQPSAKEDRGQ